MTTPETSTAVLRRLFWPVYVPTIVYAAGAAALLPAQVLVAIRLGFSDAQVALLATWLGAFAVAASFASGYVVGWLGERRAVALTTAVGVLALLLAAGGVVARAPWAAAGLVAALTLFDLTDAIWSIARQGLVADLAPLQHRGRAMNTYGAAQRVGRVIGPVLAAGVLLVTGPAIVLAAAAGVIALAAFLLLRRLGDHAPAPVAWPQQPAEAEAASRRSMRAMAALGVGVLVLSALRMAKDTLVPLWGVRAVGLAEAPLAAVVAAAAGAELLLFWPAGWALDRLGRGPVVVTCLATMSVGLLLMPLHRAVPWFLATAVVVALGDGVGAGLVKTLGIDIAPRVGRSRFLGWWQSVSSTGTLVAPALAGAVIASAGLPGVLPAVGVLGVAGATWMAYWTPRFIPRPPRSRVP